MFLDKTWCPSNIIEVINKEIFLPQIQRGYEWQGDRIEWFFDSLIKGFPMGLVLLYKHDDSFTLYGRKFLEKYDGGTKKYLYDYDERIEKDKLLVLDGQQRLQSLYLGIKGTFEGQTLYHNVLWTKQPDIHELTFMLIKSDQPSIRREEKLYIQMPILYRIIENLKSSNALTRKDKLKEFKEFCSKKGIAFESEDESEQVFDYISDRLEKCFFSKDYFGRKLELQVIDPQDIIKIGGNSLPTLLEIFVRFNQGGLRLEKSDLMFSVLKAHGWKEAENELSELSEKTGISKDLLLKALTIIVGIDARKDIFEAADRTDAMSKAFPDFKDRIMGLHDRIKELTQVPERFFLKFNFQIPVVYYLYKCSGALSQTPFPKDLLEYMLVVAYNSNLRSDSYLQQIINIINEHLKKGQNEFPIESILAYMRKAGVKTYLDGESLNRDPILTFSLIQKSNWRPLSEGNRLHIDHIFPKSKIGELPEGSEEFVDSIWNKYVVFQGDNVRKNDLMPEEYFTGDKSRLKKDYVLPEDPSMIKKERFLEFIEWRKKEIMKCFEENLGIKIYDGQQPKEPTESTDDIDTPNNNDYEKLAEEALEKIFGEKPSRKERTLYSVKKGDIIVRVSQRYPGSETEYWYAITKTDLERMKKYNVKKYAFVMIGTGTLILESEEIKKQIQNGLFNATISKEGLRHYHMRIKTEGERIIWKLKDQEIDVTKKVVKEKTVQ
ncbi:MAG: DUF262 domain-containing protein [Candidatus Methanosuratincola sp.]|jgi:hypothetical protein